MNIVLSEEMQQELTDSLLHVVEGYLNSLQFESKEKQPFLGRKKAAEWFGVSPMTLDAWVKAGAPVAIVNGSKLLVMLAGNKKSRSIPWHGFSKWL